MEVLSPMREGSRAGYPGADGLVRRWADRCFWREVRESEVPLSLSVGRSHFLYVNWLEPKRFKGLASDFLVESASYGI